MILRRLVEYADNRMSLPPVMYGEIQIHWLVSVNFDGELEGFIPQGDNTKKSRSGQSLTVPTLRRTSGVKPRLLADNGEYVLGDYRRDDDPKKVNEVVERHRQFADLVRLCAEKTKEPSIEAIVDFLDRWSFDPSFFPEHLAPEDNFTFRVGGLIPAVELKSVQQFWADYTASNQSKSSRQAEGTCLVTGVSGPVEKRMPVPVKGLMRIGGKAENSLVTANEDAFQSYGLKNSLTSPISRDAGERFGKALNHLLSDERSRIFIADGDKSPLRPRKEARLSAPLRRDRRQPQRRPGRRQPAPY